MLYNENELLELIRQGHRWIDVRAPIEFQAGSIPNAINLPILDDEERRLVGTEYKTRGQAAAVQLGHQLVSGINKELKIQAWVNELKQNANISLFCFRGGMRSQISQQWIKDAGFEISRVAGGYKLMRSVMTTYLRSKMESCSMHLISGATGSRKTQLIQWLKQNNYLALDLEQHAGHRGSAFGRMGVQPQQVNFEHGLVKETLELEGYIEDKKILYLEDESRLIGRCVIPDFIFAKMREAPILWVDEPIEIRIENIFNDYVMDTDIAKSHDDYKIESVYRGYLESLSAIKKRLGLEKFLEICNDIEFSKIQSLTKKNHESNKIWISKLLVSYYDPLYFSSLQRRNPQTLIKARSDDIKSFVSRKVK